MTIFSIFFPNVKFSNPVVNFISNLLKSISTTIPSSCSATLLFSARVLNVQSPNQTALDFIEFCQCQKAFVAVLDSGAQINLIHPALLKNFLHRTVPGTTSHFEGVQGRRSHISKHVSIPMTFPNGLKTSVVFAVSSDAPRTILLGKPFHQQISAVIDHGNRILTTKEGPIPLLEGRTVKLTSLINLAAASDSPNLPSFDYLPSDQRQKLINLLTEFQDTYKNKRRGRSKLITHKIRLDTERAIVSKPRPEAEEHRKNVGGEIDEMLASNVLRPSNSPYSSEVVMIRKPDGTWRFCIDFRQLNSHTIKDKYPLPRISNLLRAVKGSRHSTLR